MPALTKTVRPAAIAALTALGISGMALAAWSPRVGAGAAGSDRRVAITGTVAPGIQPGAARAVSFTAANAGESAILVSSIRLAGITVDAGHAACVTRDFSMANVTQAHEVPAEAIAESLPAAGSLVYANTSVNQDACKGAKLRFAFNATGSA
jgi:hypothetical protein